LPTPRGAMTGSRSGASPPAFAVGNVDHPSPPAAFSTDSLSLQNPLLHSDGVGRNPPGAALPREVAEPEEKAEARRFLPNTYWNRVRARVHPALLLHRATFSQVIWSFLGSFTAIAVLAALTFDVMASVEHTPFLFIVGSFGAQATLVFAAPRAHLSQPWNCIVGNSLSATVGLVIAELFGGHYKSVASALAVSLAIVVMLLTRSLHPPGGATALIAVLGAPQVVDAGWLYIIFPSFTGSVIVCIIGILMNNLSARDHLRSYPAYWDAADLGSHLGGYRCQGRQGRSRWQTASPRMLPAAALHTDDVEAGGLARAPVVPPTKKRKLSSL